MTYGFTRQEIATFVREPFERLETVQRQDLLKTLHDQGAPAQMIEVISTHVPESAKLTDLRSLWPYLSDVPLQLGTS